MNTRESAGGSPTVAIVGSGPAGCYLAQFLRKHWRDAQIVIFDRLDLPYGLVRYGVAPDHLGTKAVTKQFDRLFERDAVTFVGATEIGSDITLAALREAFDIVVLATGLPADRALDDSLFTQEAQDLEGVFGAGAITRLINGHPEETAHLLQLGQTVTIVGHGNVAIDLVRLFLTPPEQLLALGVPNPVVDAIGRGPVRLIEVVGRSSAASAKFDVAMAKELGALPDVRFMADQLSEADDLLLDDPLLDDPRTAAVRELVSASPQQASRAVHFRFGWTPAEVSGSAVGGSAVGGSADPERTVVERITFQASDGSGAVLSIDTDSVCTAIGFSEAADAVIRRIQHETGHSDLGRGFLDDGLFCVGWLRRGPQGTIPANRIDARMVADQIIATVDAGGIRPVKPGLHSLTSPTLAREHA